MMKLAKKLITKLSTFINSTKDLKIDDIQEETQSGLLYLIIQINGKFSAPIKKDPYELLIENGGKIADLFSKEDFEKIIATMLENQKRITTKKYQKVYSIVKHQLAEKTGEPLIFYKHITTGQCYVKDAKEILYVHDLLSKFDSEDSACIGNLVGEHNAEKEIALREIAKKSLNVIPLKGVGIDQR